MATQPYEVSIQGDNWNDGVGRSITSSLKWFPYKIVSADGSPTGEIMQIREKREPHFFFDGILKGSSGHLHADRLEYYAKHRFPLRFKWGSRDWYISPTQIPFEELISSTQTNAQIIYRFIGKRNCEAKLGYRARAFGYKEESDNLSYDGVTNVSMPPNTTLLSQTSDWDRKVWWNEQEYTIQNVSAPTGANRILYKWNKDGKESNLEVGSVRAFHCLEDDEWELNNGLIKVRSRHGESSATQRLDFSHYTGTAWSKIGTITAQGKSSGGTQEEVDAAPNIDIGKNHWLHKSFVISWPSTSTNSYNIAMEINMDYGTPVMRCYGYSYGDELGNAVQLTDFYYTIDDCSFSYYYNDTDDFLLASDDTYGTPRTTALDAETDSASFLLDTSTVGAASIMVGIGSIKKANRDAVCNDGGSVWDSLSYKFDSLTLSQTAGPAPLAYIWAQKYSTMGSRSAENLTKEAMMKRHFEETVVAVERE